jgi:hypothetical protein
MSEASTLLAANTGAPAPSPAAPAPSPAAPAPSPAAPAPSPAAPAPSPAAPAPSPAAPAEVVYDLKTTDGKAFEGAAADELKAFAKENGLKPEAAQKLVGMREAVVKEHTTAESTKYQATVTQWDADARADPEIGGANFDQTMAAADKVLEVFDKDRALTKFMTASGLAKNPHALRFLARVKGAISEDRFVTGGARPDGSGGDARGLYPNSNHN